MWVLWIKQWLLSSQTCININGQLTAYFTCKRGVRQGDPLSPFLFLLVGDVLCKMFNKGRSHSLIQGLGPRLDTGVKITNCHYADDTILFLAHSPKNIEYALWTMLGFEALSGIKINFQKT